MSIRLDTIELFQIFFQNVQKLRGFVQNITLS